MPTVMVVSPTPASSNAATIPTTISSIGFGKRLAHTEKSIRDKAVKSLQEYLTANAKSLSDLEFLKLWKGLYYCFWMSDKPLIQQGLAQNLASTITRLPASEAIRYIHAFWKTLIKEWYGIDRLRLDKFYLLCRQFHLWTFTLLIENDWDKDLLDKVFTILEQGPLSINNTSVPDSLRYHTSEVMFEELAKAIKSADEEGKLPQHAFDRLTSSHFLSLEKSDNQQFLQHIVDDFLVLWTTKVDAEDELSLEDTETTTPPNASKIVQECMTSAQLVERLHQIALSNSALKRNRKTIHLFNKRLAKSLGLPYSDPTFSIGMTASTIPDLPVASSTLAAAKTTKKKSKQAKGSMVSLSKAVEVYSEADLWEEGQDNEEAKATSESSSSAAIDNSIEVVEADTAVAAEVSESVSTDSVSVETESTKKRKRKALKKVAKEFTAVDVDAPVEVISGCVDDLGDDDTVSKKSRIEAVEDVSDIQEGHQEVFEDPSGEAAAQSDVDTLDDTNVSPSGRKSVRWGTKLRVKTFFKLKPICASSEIKTPEHKPATKSALRKSPAKFDTMMFDDCVDGDMGAATPDQILDQIALGLNQRRGGKRGKKGKKTRR
ncbi:hypothetical protein BASA83_012206 [Batrachochytrium salamandrivorans]|nr:hypothetical protein BASA83_012206 [Batrachochytrium salamandrivorans]